MHGHAEREQFVMCSAPKSRYRNMSVVLIKMPPKKNAIAKAATSAVSSVPNTRRPRCATGVKLNSRKRGASAAVSDTQSESSSSDDDSDPDDDVLESDLYTADGHHALDFECVRAASRSRVAEKTRTQYDQFIGMMAVFALSREEFKSLVFVKQTVVTFHMPLPLHFVSAYLTHVETKRVQWPGKVGQVKPVSPSYYKAVVLSIKDLYTCEQTVLADDLSLFLFSKRKKFQRDIQEMRAVGTYPSAHQRYITSEGYRELAKTVVSASPSDVGGWAVQAFAALWGYLVLLWCLMARCDRVARMRWADFGWYQDAMTAYICKSKCDQAGVNAFHKKLYYNDAEPAVCPITALAVVFFSREEECVRSEFVFPRCDTRRNGHRHLQKIIGCKYTSVDASKFGCDPLGISWHHFKRGAFTFLAGLTDACSYVATKMRADQKVLDVSRVYAFFGQGQDGVVGRLLSMLPYGEPEFIGCAPVLSSEHASISWVDVVPDWDTLDDNFKFVVVPRLFAVLVRRLDWLKQNLPCDHPLWHSDISTSGKLLQFIPFVHLESRPLANLTGVSLEMKNAIRLIAIASSQHTPTLTAAPLSSNAPLPLQVPPSERDDLGLRLLTPLPVNKRVVPHLTCQQAWRAYFITTDSLPYPLRYAEGKLSIGSDVTALSRIKTVMNAVAKGIAPKDILQYPEATFQCGFANLQQSLFEVDPTARIFPFNTCGTIEAKLRDAKLIGWRAIDASFCLGVVPARPSVYDVADARERQVRLAEARQRRTSSVCEQCRGVCLHCSHCDACNTRIQAAAAVASTARENATARAAAAAADAAAAAAAADAAAHEQLPSGIRVPVAWAAGIRDVSSKSSAAAEHAMVVVAAPSAAVVPSENRKVRCLHCRRCYADKSGYNRHLKSTAACFRAHSFEHIL